MRRIFFLITVFLFILKALINPVFAEEEPIKVLSLNYDNSSSIVFISTKDNVTERAPQNLKYVKLSNPNRIYFDINDAVLIGGKQHLVFDKSNIKEIKLAQFDTNPNIVRTVITFEEDFDTSKIKLVNIDGNVLVKIHDPAINNDYFNNIYTECPSLQEYSSIIVNSQVVQKVPVQEAPIKAPENVMDDIKRAFSDSTLQSSDGETYSSIVAVDISSALKLRTKYYINQYIPKNGGLLVSGLGQISTEKMFYLTSPTRAVIDSPDTYLDKSIRNKEVQLCPDGSCKDTAKIGQFEHNKARIVINSERADKYLPIYSQDMQSLFLIDTEKLNHTSLTPTVSNINKAFVKKIDNKTGELILSFSEPVVHSILRTDNAITIFLFNVKSYNEQDLIKTLDNTMYSKFTMSLLPQIGVRAGMTGLSKEDIVTIDQSVDARALRITVAKNKLEEPKQASERQFRKKTKDKIVLDAGHGGTDYGAIREGINEKDITLDITQRIEAILRSKGYKVALTRSDDTYVSLEDRVDFSETEEPEIFVSIHVNSAVSTTPNGIETHWYHDYSKDLAETVHKHLVKELPNANDRGLFKSKFYVINHTTDPAILCEIGFLSNDEERNELITDSRKQKTAKAIADGIIEYLKGAGKNK